MLLFLFDNRLGILFLIFNFLDDIKYQYLKYKNFGPSVINFSVKKLGMPTAIKFTQLFFE
jgi:hypothetical protein